MDGSNSAARGAEIADRIRVAYEKCERASEDWINNTLELAAALKEGRDLCGNDDRAFGIWLVEHDLELFSRHDRAALIGIAKNPELSRIKLMETDRRSWQLIWQTEIQPKLGSILTVRTDTTSPTNSTETAPPAEQDTSSPSRTGSDSASEVDSKEAITTRVLEFVNSGKSFVATAAELGMTKGQVAGIWHRNKDDAADSRSPRSKKKAGSDMLLEIFLHSKTRATLRKLAETSKSGAWQFLIECHRDLKTEPTDDGIGKPDLRLIFPWLKSNSRFSYAMRFDLTSKDDRQQIKDEIIPIVRAYEAELRAKPDGLAQLVDTIRRERHQTKAHEIQQVAVERARANMPTNEQEIIFHGHRLWPLAHNEKLLTGPDYATLCFAIWWFNDAAKKKNKDDTPRDIAIGIRWLMRFQIEWSATRDEAVRVEINRFCQQISDLSVLYEKAEGKGESKIPHAPIRIEGACASI